MSRVNECYIIFKSIIKIWRY